MPQTYHVKLSDGREFNVTTEGGAPSEADVLNSLSGNISSQIEKPAEAPAPDSAAYRFASNFGEMINPVAAVKGVYGALRHPIDTGGSILRGQQNEVQKAAEMLRAGRYSEAGGHAAASMLPILGPLAAEAGEQIGTGDVAGGMGKAAGILVPFGGAEVLARTGAAVVPNQIASSLERMGAKKLAETMSPKSGTRIGRVMGNKAEKIAPELLKDKDLTAWTREGLHSAVKEKRALAEAGLDEAADARLSARTYDTEPIVSDLRGKLSKLTAEAVDASKPARETSTRASSILDESGRPMTVTTKTPTPIGKDVIPAPSHPRAAQIQQAIDEITALGPVATYEDLRKIRASYDGPANAKYNPSMTDDYLRVKGSSEGAADVTGSLREHLAKFDPETAAANADYSLYRSADDILTATTEIEKAKPKVGRQIMARLTGALVGHEAGGLPGMLAGIVAGPVVDATVSSGMTSKIKTARLLSDVAEAIRKGDVSRATSLGFKLRQLAKQSQAVTSRNAMPEPVGAGSQ